MKLKQPDARFAIFHQTRALIRCFACVVVVITAVASTAAGQTTPSTSAPAVAQTQSPAPALTAVHKSVPQQTPTPDPNTSIRFAVIGDYGADTDGELAVANLVKSWKPSLIITVGDNNYLYGEPATIDRNIGKYYHEFIHPYTGVYGAGADANRFFPTLGNHDWKLGDCTAYTNYFALPNNERYYDFVRGPVHFFAIDSDGHEPDGTSRTSVQAMWLKARLAASTARWKIVYFHHPPYSSSRHGSAKWMQWAFREWGASAVLSGHDHTYERIDRDGFPYFVNGLGGKSRYAFGDALPGSVVRYNSGFGAQIVEATQTWIKFEFYNTDNQLIDTFTLR